MTTKIVRFNEPVWVTGFHSGFMGPLSMAVTARGLVRVEWCLPEELATEQSTNGTPSSAPEVLVEMREQMVQYLDGQRKEFTVPIDYRGLTPFDEKVLRANFLLRYGEVVTYTEMANRAGCGHAVRAVGTALGRNPMPIVIPCHRVVAMDGRLNHYGAPDGIRVKAWLLELEGVPVAEGKQVRWT